MPRVPLIERASGPAIRLFTRGLRLPAVLAAAAGLGPLAGSIAHAELGFAIPRVVTTQVDRVSAVVAADLDGDGDLDLLTSSTLDDKVAWYENTDGRGAFGAQVTLTTTMDRPQEVLAADVDGDGDLDVVAAARDDDTVQWFENTDGQASFGPGQLVGTNDGASGIAIGDIDQDGDPDVVVAGRYADSIQWWAWLDGPGSYDTLNPTPVGTGDGPFQVELADLDHDGDLDVAVANFDGDTVEWHENTDGAGTFALGQVVATGFGGVREVVAMDVDQDGDRDLVAVASLDDEIAWWENQNGQGLFGDARPIASGVAHALDLDAVDLDQDGDLDLTSAVYDDGELVWIAALPGFGCFAAPSVVHTDALVRQLIGADLDGDGWPDLVGGISNGTSLHWWRNEGPVLPPPGPMFIEQAATLHPASDSQGIVACRSLVFTSDRDGPSGIYEIDEVGSTNPLSVGPANRHSAASDGARIVFEDLTLGNLNVMITDNHTGISQYVTLDGADDHSPDIDGDTIVFVSTRLGTPDVFTTSLLTGATASVASGPDTERNPSISGDLIAWQREDFVQSAVWGMRIGNAPFQISLPAETIASSPSVSGDRVAYFSQSGIEVYDTVTEHRVSIPVPSARTALHLHEDFVAWSDNRNGNYDVFLHDLATRRTYQTTTDPTDQFVSDLTDGRILLDDARLGNANVYVIDFSLIQAVPALPWPWSLSLALALAVVARASGGSRR